MEFMRPKVCDAPNALDLVKELDDATEQMMALGVDQVGTVDGRKPLIGSSAPFEVGAITCISKPMKSPPQNSSASLDHPP
jgi:uncharacterized protein (DUF779 family)